MDALRAVVEEPELQCAGSGAHLAAAKHGHDWGFAPGAIQRIPGAGGEHSKAAAGNLRSLCEWECSSPLQRRCHQSLRHERPETARFARSEGCQRAALLGAARSGGSCLGRDQRPGRLGTVAVPNSEPARHRAEDQQHHRDGRRASFIPLPVANSNIPGLVAALCQEAYFLDPGMPKHRQRTCSRAMFSKRRHPRGCRRRMGRCDKLWSSARGRHQLEAALDAAVPGMEHQVVSDLCAEGSEFPLDIQSRRMEIRWR